MHVAARLSDAEPFRIEADGDVLNLAVHLPFTERGEVQLGRTDDELVLTVGPHRRTIVLPDSLVRRSVGGARFVEDNLVVEFI